jgi:enoyl-CoA hydratase/carnithine racemase
LKQQTEAVSPVTTTEADGIGTITIDRPDALNALNRDVLERLLASLSSLVSAPSVRVIVLVGAGDKAFIAGADIDEFVGATVQDALVIAQRIRAVTDLMTSCPKPIIGSIGGYCLGGGFELALACDLRIAATNAKFGLPEIKLGILPGGGGTVRLTKIAGSSIARELSMTGDFIGAERAHTLGLVVSIHPSDQLAEATAALASKLASKSPFALAQLKSSLNIAMDGGVSNALDAEIKSFALCYATADKEEGVRAFIEKRQPKFIGR